MVIMLLTPLIIAAVLYNEEVTGLQLWGGDDGDSSQFKE